MKYIKWLELEKRIKPGSTVRCWICKRSPFEVRGHLMDWSDEDVAEMDWAIDEELHIAICPVCTIAVYLTAGDRLEDEPKLPKNLVAKLSKKLAKVSKEG